MENPAEVQELRNKLRMMKFPQDEILNVVRRQQRAIHKQKQANETLRNEIDQYESQINRIQQLINAHKTNEDLLRLESQKKTLSNKFSILSADYKEEDKKRKKLEEEVSKARSKAGGIFAQARENEEIQSQLHTMENRLDKALTRYNNNLTKLAAMRSQLDEYRKDRFTFIDVIKKAKSDKEVKDQQMSQLISVSNDAYSKRDQMKMQMAQIKSAEKEDIMVHDQEITRLNQNIESQKITQGHSRDPQMPISSTNSQIGSQSDQQEELTALTDSMQTSNMQILDMLHFKDVNELIEEAEKLERENFSLYNFVVEHGATRTELQEEIDRLEIQREQAIDKSNLTEEQQTEQLKELTKQINEYSVKVKSLRESHEKNKGEFKKVYDKLEHFFNKLECSWDDSPDEKSHITTGNAMYALVTIEKRVADLMNEVCDRAQIQYQEKLQDPASLLGSDEKTSESAVSRSPNHGRTNQDREISSKTIEATRPMTLDEIRDLLGESF